MAYEVMVRRYKNAIRVHAAERLKCYCQSFRRMLQLDLLYIRLKQSFE
jgi:hypothetical protein